MRFAEVHPYSSSHETSRHNKIKGRCVGGETLELIAEGCRVRSSARRLGSKKVPRRWRTPERMAEEFATGAAPGLDEHQNVDRPERPKPTGDLVICTAC